MIPACQADVIDQLRCILAQPSRGLCREWQEAGTLCVCDVNMLMIASLCAVSGGKVLVLAES
jgi:hypothetical protein